MYGNLLFHIIWNHANDVKLLGRSVHTIRKNTEDLVIASKEIGLEVNADKTKYCTWLCLEIRRQDEVTI